MRPRPATRDGRVRPIAGGIRGVVYGWSATRASRAEEDGTAEDLGAGSVPRGIGKSGGRRNKKGSSSTTKQGLARDLFLLDFWDVTVL